MRGTGFVLIAGLLLAGAPLAAQLQSGNIYADVVDTDAAPLPGVTVTLTGGGAPTVQITGPEGQARFLGLSPGNYRIEAALEGFSTVVYDTVNVRVGQNTSIQLQMSAAVEEVITVTAESPLLDERKVSSGATVSQTELEKVPTSRDPWAVLGTTPGVRTDRINVGGNESGQQSMYVGPGSSNAEATWAIDGVVVTDMGAIGSSPTYYNFDAFEEMQVSTGGSDASLATGGVALNMVTKRGTNEWRGSGRFIMADDSWQSDVDLDESELGQAGPWNRDSAQPEIRQGNAIVSVEDWGAEVGGPLLKDRVWIWANYGKQDVKLLTVAAVPDDTELDTYGAKLNAQLTSSNSLVAFYNYGDKVKNGRNAGPTRPQPTTWNQTGPTDVYKLEDTHIFGNDFFLTGLVSYVGGGFELTPAGGLDGPTAYFDASGVWQNNFLHHETDRPQEQARIDGSYFFATGRLNHELKFGAGYREVELYSLSVWPGNVFGLDFGDAAMAVVMRPRVSNASTEYTGAFVQDTLSVGNLTANVGIRYDLQKGSNDRSSVPAVAGLETLDGEPLFPAATFEGADMGFEWEDVTPRLGLTYALGEQRDTLLRASWARFASQLQQGFTLQTHPSGYSYAYFYAYEGLSDLAGGRLTPSQLTDPDGPWFFLYTNGFDPALQETPFVVDPDFSAPLTDELLVSVEHALMPELVIGASVTWRQLSNLAETERLIYCGADETGCFRDNAGDLVRLHRRDDYVRRDADLRDVPGTGNTVTLPNGQVVEVPSWGLRDGLELSPGSYLTNGDREQEYLGGSVTFNKRLSHHWMLRGNVTLSDWTWDIPDAEREDPNLGLGGGDDDGGPVLAGSGTGSGAKGSIYVSSNWSYDLVGLYQIAPETAWGFNVSAHLYGREGYPVPYYARVRCGDLGLGAECASLNLQVTNEADDFRNPDIHLVDLRIEKELTFDRFNLTLLGEVFNLLNDNDPLQRQHRLGSGPSTVDTGSESFLVNGADWVTETVSPRVFRIGTRFSFR